MVNQGSQCPSPDSLIYPPDPCARAPYDPAMLRDLHHSLWHRAEVSELQLRSFLLPATPSSSCVQIIPAKTSLSPMLHPGPSCQSAGKFCHHLFCGGFRKSWDWVPGLELSVPGSWEVGRIDLLFGQHTWDHVTPATGCLSR